MMRATRRPQRRSRGAAITVANTRKCASLTLGKGGHMKHLTMIAAAMTLVAIPTFAADSDTRRATQERINRAERRETRQDIEKLIQDINSLESQPAARRAGVAEAARQAA